MVGAPAGTHLHRPGAAFDAPVDFVSVVPPDDPYVATFYACHPGAPADAIELYVDITTAPLWSDDGSRLTVTMTDLDLDVVRGRSGRVWVDDEDEFADHRVRFGYPAEIVRLAGRTCDQVHAGVREGAGPFARDLGQAWLSRLSSALA